MKFIRQNLLPYITFIYDKKKNKTPRCDTNSKLANRTLKCRRRKQQLEGKKKNKAVQFNYRCTVG